MFQENITLFSHKEMERLCLIGWMLDHNRLPGDTEPDPNEPVFMKHMPDGPHLLATRTWAERIMTIA